MARPISLFSGYSQRENRVTNYCLLVLKMLYEENPKYLAQVLRELIDDEASNHVGVVFGQQERNETSVPDGVISQSAFSIYIETKNFDWFYDDQLLRHLDSLKKQQGYRVLLALGKFDGQQLDKFDSIRRICNEHAEGKISFVPVSFETFVGAVQIAGLPKNLADTMREFRQFLDAENLLSTWDKWLDVVNCAGIPEDVLEHGVYMCPAEGGAYSHDRCRFFGMYRNKRVECVAEIEGVVDVDLSVDEAKVLWNNTGIKLAELTSRAKATVKKSRPDHGPTRVFLLGPLEETDFRKDTPGGMQGSKRYFEVGHLNPTTASALAMQLRGKTWTAFGPPVGDVPPIQ